MPNDAPSSGSDPSRPTRRAFLGATSGAAAAAITVAQPVRTRGAPGDAAGDSTGATERLRS